MNSLNVKLRGDKLSIEKSIFALRNFLREISGSSSKQIRARLDALQTERNQILSKIDETERLFQIASENGNLSQVAANLYQKNSIELGRQRQKLETMYNDIYTRIKQKYEKAVLLGHHKSDEHELIDVGKHEKTNPRSRGPRSQETGRAAEFDIRGPPQGRRGHRTGAVDFGVVYQTKECVPEDHCQRGRGQPRRRRLAVDRDSD